MKNAENIDHAGSKEKNGAYGDKMSEKIKDREKEYVTHKRTDGGDSTKKQT